MMIKINTFWNGREREREGGERNAEECGVSLWCAEVYAEVRKV